MKAFLLLVLCLTVFAADEENLISEGSIRIMTDGQDCMIITNTVKISVPVQIQASANINDIQLSGISSF
jgi:hypothetical protein